MAIFCKEYYKINNAITGVVLTDAAFITDLTGNAQARVWQNKVSYPDIYAISGVEALKTATKVAPRGYLNATLLNCEGVNRDYDSWQVPIPWWSAMSDVTAGDLQYSRQTVVNERFDENVVNMPYPEGSTLCDADKSKLYGTEANTYTAFVLYQLVGAPCAPPRGGKVHIVTYDKGSDYTTLIWEQAENAAQNAAGELQKDHDYRLLWGAFDAQALADSEELMARVTVSNYPPLTFVGGGSYYNAIGARRIWFLTDSITLRGDAVHKVEGQVGTTSQGLVHLAWEDMGKRK